MQNIWGLRFRVQGLGCRVVLKILGPSWVYIILRHLIFRGTEVGLPIWGLSQNQGYLSLAYPKLKSHV